MLEIIFFLKNTLKKLFLYILVLILINIILFSIVVFKSNQVNKINDILTKISNGINIINNDYLTSKESTDIMKNENLWGILIDKNSGNVIWSYNKPKEVSDFFDMNDVAIFSKFYLNDYPVFLRTRTDGLLVVAFPKDSFVKYNSNYFPYPLIKNAPVIIFLYFSGNLIVVFILLLFTHFKLAKEIQPISDAILSIPNSSYYTSTSNNDFKQIYKSINKINALLNKNEKERNIWIESISHDIRTPLSNIIGFSSSLLNNSDLDIGTKEKIRQIEIHGKYISELINNLNLNSKLNNEYTLKLQKINIIPFVKNTIINVINENETSLFHIDFIIGKNLKNDIYVNIDILLFERLIRNIIYNSMKHNPSGCDLKIQLDYDKSKLHMIFQDNGIGVDDAVSIIENINKQKSSSTSLNKLGLFIVSRIIELHNGEMYIYSKKNNYFIVKFVIDVLC